MKVVVYTIEHKPNSSMAGIGVTRVFYTSKDAMLAAIRDILDMYDTAYHADARKEIVKLRNESVPKAYRRACQLASECNEITISLENIPIEGEPPTEAAAETRIMPIFDSADDGRLRGNTD